MNIEDLMKPAADRKDHLDKLLLEERDGLHYVELFDFIKTQGIDKVTTKDMNRLVEKYGRGVMGINGFTDYYSIISSNESNKVMKDWTKAIGIMTIVVMLATLIMLFR
ncbi:hypothetical protein [Paenibacillus prosopidis]|uniref:Uncharacterized protein n=1 Tax=Paenibacillus prosopidis TaxID=630520 RepID=A0A368VR80_9BACL|nr:hypothetical protein [Paenibacillus prosopidis]RCW44209.1 hypothetical protein DFP97_11273 [Paenibacillus prosopidis]